MDEHDPAWHRGRGKESGLTSSDPPLPEALLRAAPFRPALSGSVATARGVNFSYPPRGKTAAPLRVLSDVNLDVGPSDFVSIIGPSGCGKSGIL